ncbi:M24 family metallopeptidase [Undibacterium umbellatum]|uniref:M24 family metallopeptidase n=1 Tax=Undibacterium umbellatum TaxID=2762300 RepID=A0ABR6ZFY8_9BURK|nr:M24 family metallopeptidase [Undibacterium umbellatum]MBC3910589.1 M24 family metallopeptidase [Undibacterium umbellatum]
MSQFRKTKTVAANTVETNQQIASLVAVQNQIFARLLDSLEAGVSTADVAALADELALEHAVHSSLPLMNGFPAGISISVNQEITNGVPRSDKLLKDGDVVKLAFGLHHLQQAFSMQNWTVQIGAGTAIASDLLGPAHAILQESISMCRPGMLVSEIGKHLQQTCSKTGLFISELFAGHFIGEQVHMLPQVLPRSGMFEPEHILSAGCMLNLMVLAHPAKPSVKQLKDQWTVTDRNCYPSACYSHMVLITDDVPKVLTATYPLKKGSPISSR